MALGEYIEVNNNYGIAYVKILYITNLQRDIYCYNTVK